GPEAAAFGEAARDTDGVEFFVTMHADVAAAFGLPAGEAPALAVVKKEEERLVVFDGEYSKEAISAFLAANRLPLLLTYTEETSAAIFSSPIGKQVRGEVLLFAPDSAFKVLSPALFAAAKQFKGQAMFVFVNTSDPESQPVQEYFGADASTTAFMGFTMGGGEDPSVPAAGLKYRMTDHPTTDNIKAFTQSFIDGRLKPFFKSQPIPEENEGPVAVVVGDSFERIVLEDTRDVLLEVRVGRGMVGERGRVRGVGERGDFEQLLHASAPHTCNSTPHTFFTCPTVSVFPAVPLPTLFPLPSTPLVISYSVSSLPPHSPLSPHSPLPHTCPSPRSPLPSHSSFLPHSPPPPHSPLSPLSLLSPHSFRLS
ncbi:unnamed protein product, partial [Closterium sp. NIES-53]